VVAVLEEIPTESLSSGLRLPAAAFLPELLDYLPLRFCLAPGAPAGLQVQEVTGELRGSVEGAFTVELRHAEGIVRSVKCVVGGSGRCWEAAAAPLVERFKVICGLLPAAPLQEQLAELYDFQRKRMRSTSLREWLLVMDKLLRMLRSASVANIAPQKHSPLGGAELVE